jgi:hypothetical protein
MPVTPLVGGKKVIFSLKKSDYRISSCAVFALLDEIGNRTIAIIDIDRIAI